VKLPLAWREEAGGILRFLDGHEVREAKILNGLHKRLERRYLR
jgi:hypothetical protein